MSHFEIETITDYVHHALEAEQDAQVFGHLQTCDDCRAQYEGEVSLIDALRSQASSEEREFPESLRLSILAATTSNNRRSILDHLFGPLRPAVLSFVAAAAAVAFLVTPHFMSTTTVPATKTLTASAFFSRHDAAAMETPLADHAGAPSIEAAAFVADDTSDSSATNPD